MKSEKTTPKSEKNLCVLCKCNIITLVFIREIKNISVEKE